VNNHQLDFGKLNGSQREKAELFRSLHQRKSRILILPNAWDVPSARVFENAGFPAVATSSAGMLVSLGYQDGEQIGREDFLLVVKRIAGVLSVPLSADSLAGFGKTPKEVETTIIGLIEAGAVGLNIEDYDHATTKLLPADKQVEKLRAIKKVAESMNVPLVINARTDALRYADGGEEEKFAEAVRRGRMYRDVGVDCVYPMGLAEKFHIAEFVRSLDNFPVNIMIRKGIPNIEELKVMGVSRVSFGPGASYAAMGLLKRISREILENGTYSSLLDGAISFDELNALAMRKS
jgi:2-methylisocitrate lyase-like PEP mutase family enzyme